MAEEKRKVITVKLTPNKGSLGISLLLVSKQKVIVNKVSPNKPAHGKIFIGDVILSVNGKKVRCLSDFGEAIKSNSEEKHKVKLRRARLNRFLGHEHNLLVHRLEGFDYFLFQMNISAGKMSKKPFGAAVVTWRQRVIIGDIQPDSVAQEYFQPLDRVLTVNGTPVNTADQSAQIIKDSDGKLTIMIERPLTDETKESSLIYLTDTFSHKTCERPKASNLPYRLKLFVWFGIARPAQTEKNNFPPICLKDTVEIFKLRHVISG